MVDSSPIEMIQWRNVWRRSGMSAGGMEWDAETDLRHVTSEASVSRKNLKSFFCPLSLPPPGDIGGVLFNFILFTLLCGVNSSETWVSAEETAVSSSEM